MHTTRLVVGQLQVNCYIITPAEGAEFGAVIDPGAEAEKIITCCERLGVTPRYIINTHGHHDHIGADLGLTEKYPDAEFCIGAQEKDLLMDPQRNLSAEFGASEGPPEPDRLLDEGDTLELDDLVIEVLDTPGHTAGGISLVARQDDETVIFCGDLLFAGSVGRTDLPGGDVETLENSVQKNILSFPDDTPLYSGHGPATTVGKERQHNPFIARLLDKEQGQK